MESKEDTEDYPVCEVCRMGDREFCLLLCDACNLPYHYDCLDPPLFDMPVDEWFCPPCASVMARMGDALPSISQYRRVIPRTKASESIRLKIENDRRSYLPIISRSTPNASKNKGSSHGSQAVEYSLPDRPGKPIMKGRTHSTFFKMAWEHPKKDGGCPITEYNLEMDSGNGFESIYRGDKLEHMCENLMPGKSYTFRVQCSSLGGQSEFSDGGTAVTWPVVPGKCEIPKVLGKPKHLSIHLKWSNPEYDGGAEVLGFVIELINPDGSTRVTYRGPDTDCAVTGLSPGRVYKFRVRAYNKVGAGPWSEPLEDVRGVGTPEPPADVRIVPSSPHCVFASWAQPFHNGALITEYRLEAKYNDREFELVYSGPTCSAEVKSLIPATMYYFHVLAINSAGEGPFSECVSCCIPPTSPGAVSSTSIRTDIEASAITLWWKEPNNHGAPILSYNIEVGKALYTAHGEKPERRLEGLMPETIYKVRIQAINSVGSGPFSSPMKLVTRGLPPLPPILECCSSSHNSLSLKWGDGKNLNSNTYTLELEFLIGACVKMFAPMYQGPGNMFKVTKLQELTSYNFRIFASNEEGPGPFSDVFTFTTQRDLPPALKDTKSRTTSKTCFNVELLPAKAIGKDMLSYELQRGTKVSEFHLAPRKTRQPSAKSNLRPAKRCIAKRLDPCAGTIMPDVGSNSNPISQSSSSGSKYPLFDELMNCSENFNEHMVVPSTSTLRNVPRKSETCAAPSNLLDSILAEQELLHAKSGNIVIHTNGSLFQKEDKKKKAAKKTSKLVTVGSCKPDISSKHTKPERARDSSSTLLHRALTNKFSESRTQQKPATSSSNSAKDISEKTRQIKKREDSQTTKEGNSCLSQTSSDLYLKHQEKPIGSTLSISPAIPLKTDKLISGKDNSSTLSKNLSNESCDTHLTSIPTNFPHFSDNKKQSKISEKAKSSSMQENVPDHSTAISSQSNVFTTKYFGNSSGNRQSLPSDESLTCTDCKVQKLSQRSPAVKGTSQQTNEIKIKGEPLSSDDEEANSGNLIGKANNCLSITLKTEFQVSESLIRNSDTNQISSTTLNSSTVTDVSNLGLNMVNKPTQSLHHSKTGNSSGNQQSSPSDESLTRTGCKVQKLSQRSPAVKGTSQQTNEIKIKDEPLSSDDKEVYSGNLIGQANNLLPITLETEFQVSESLISNSDTGQISSRILHSSTITDVSNLEVNVINKSSQSLHCSRTQYQPIRKKSNTEKCNTHIENDKCIKMNLQSNEYSEREHGRRESNSNGNKRKADKDLHYSKERSNKHAVKDSTARNADMKKNYFEKDKHSSRVKNYKKDKHTDNYKYCHKEKVPYSKFKHSKKKNYNVMESKYSKNKCILKHSKDGYFDNRVKTSQKGKPNNPNYSDINNKHTENNKLSNKKSNFVKDGPFNRRRKRSFKASSINFNSDKSKRENKRQNICTEVNKKNCSSSSKSCLIPDNNSGPNKTEKLPIFGHSKDDTFLDARIQKTISHDDCDTASSRKRLHESMCSEDTSGISQLSNEVLLTGPFTSPKLAKTDEQTHSATSLKGSLMDGKVQDFRENQLFISTQGTGQSHFLGPPYDGRDSSNGENRGTSYSSSSTWSNRSNQNLSHRAEQRNNYGNHCFRSEYNDPFHEQNRAGQSHYAPYSHWSRYSNIIPVNRFPQVAVDGMLLQSQEHWQHYWNCSQSQSFRSEYNDFSHEQNRAGHYAPYFHWSRYSNIIPVNRFPHVAVDGMLLQGQEH